MTLKESLDKIRDEKNKKSEFEKIISAFQIVLNSIEKIKGEPGKQGETGKPGQNYILTENDKKEIASKITVPIVEKVVEKVEVVKEKPIVTEITKVTNQVKEVAVKDTPEELKEKIESLGLVLLSKDQLDAIIKETKISRIVPKKSKSYFKILSITGTKDGVNKEFYLSEPPKIGADVFIFLNGQWISPDSYTLNGVTLILGASVPAPESDWGLYAQLFKP